MSKLLAVVVGAAIVVSAAGGWKKLLSARNVQNAAKHIRETKEVFVSELNKGQTTPNAEQPSSQLPPNYQFTNPSETQQQNVSPPTTNTTNTTPEKKE